MEEGNKMVGEGKEGGGCGKEKQDKQEEEKE